MTKLGLLVEGGGMRGIYSAGVLDCFLDSHLRFDYCIGVSSGSANLASFLAKQKKRNYRFYHEYGGEKNFLSLHSFLSKGQLFGLDYIYSTVTNSNGKDPLDYETLRDNPCEYEVVATNALTGQPHYFSKRDMKQDHYDILKASSCIPIACKPVYIDDVPYYDGGVSDPVPLLRAMDRECDYVVVVLVRPLVEYEHIRSSMTLFNGSLKEYPLIQKRIKTTDSLHREEVRLALAYQTLGKCRVVAPSDTLGVSTATQDPKKLDDYYQSGYNDAAKALGGIQEDFRRLGR